MKKFILVLILFSFISLKAQKDSAGVKNYQNEIKKLLDSSNSFYNNGEYSKSIKLNMDILKKSFQIGDPYYIHQSYRYLAYDYLFLKDTLLAMESFKKSENFAKQSKNDTATAVTYMDLANVYSTYEDYTKALIYHDRSINLFTKIKDSAGMAKANYNAAITAIDALNFDKAYVYINKSFELNEYGDDESFEVNLNYFLGEYYAYKKEYHKADSIFLKTIEVAKEKNLIDEIGYIYEAYSKSLFEQKKYKEAFEIQSKFLEYYDLAKEQENDSERFALSQKYQLDEYRKDIEAERLNNQLQAEIVKSKGRVNIILIIVSAIFLILLIALYSASIRRIKLVQELRIKNKEALKAKEESEKLSQAKVKFFSTVSHELRTPLYGVIGLSSVLLEDKSLIKHKKDLKHLKFSADYLLALINDVLNINKLDSELKDSESTTFNIRELIETITSSFEYMRIQNDNQLEVEISESIPELIRGDAVQLSQILMNLIGNACKFTENGKVLIKATSTPNDGPIITIKFTIKDTGIGIANDKIDSIFDEFSQVDAHNFNNRGSGLGLPIVKKLLARSNSKIELNSELGKGSNFSFTLSFDIIKKEIGKKEPIKLNPIILKGKKILIVEDNRINQIVTRRILEQKKIICSIAENGQEAIDMIKSNNYDLVLMDINMPIKNGLEASKEVRKFNKTIPIIALTAVEIEEMRNNIYMSGMNDIVVKPYDVSKFIEAIIKNISLNIDVN